MVSNIEMLGVHSLKQFALTVTHGYPYSSLLRSLPTLQVKFSKGEPYISNTVDLQTFFQ